jgi:hypothetical protein
MVGPMRVDGHTRSARSISHLCVPWTECGELLFYRFQPDLSLFVGVSILVAVRFLGAKNLI